MNVHVLLTVYTVKYVWRWHCVRNGKKHRRKTIMRTDRAERMQIWSSADKQHTQTHLRVRWFSTVTDIKGRILRGCCPSEWTRKSFFWSHYLSWQMHQQCLIFHVKLTAKDLWKRLEHDYTLDNKCLNTNATWTQVCVCVCLQIDFRGRRRRRRGDI